MSVSDFQTAVIGDEQEFWNVAPDVRVHGGPQQNRLRHCGFHAQLEVGHLQP